MAGKGLSYQTAIAQIMADLAEYKRLYEALAEELRAEQEEVALRYRARLACHVEWIEALEARLYEAAAQYHRELFADGDIFRAPAGTLIYSRVKRVVRGRRVLKSLLALGDWGRAAVKISYAVDWDKLEKWADSALEAVGARREVKEGYGYELATPKKKHRRGAIYCAPGVINHAPVGGKDGNQ